MFTGIVEELGRLQSMEHHGDYARLQIQGQKVLSDMGLGDSIAVNGVCQTVEKFDGSSFSVATFAESLNKTSLGRLQRGDALHLERALTPDTRLGGHIVQGHVDGLGHLREIRQVKNNYYLRVDLPDELLDLCVAHGSICLDGVSLTIAKLHDDGVEVNIIDHTWQHTVFSRSRTGALINVECDILGKYILRFAQRGLLEKGGPPGGVSEKTANASGSSRDGRLLDLLQNW
ncbi:riboflavin synthase [Candidatus Haliotispira prima]|uniref:Riboflavin synthase n=1 Tax=Candidatus Haliotispira prima TaxID=3034016 RepID=A0ABY8MED6_9SPIO|nr:riboflavin synthase [Candidatus Haliotispira prima]